MPKEVYLSRGEAAHRITPALPNELKVRPYWTTISEPLDLSLHALMLVSAVLAIVLAARRRRTSVAWMVTATTFVCGALAMYLRTLQATRAMIHWQGHESFAYYLRELHEAPQPFYAGTVAAGILTLAGDFYLVAGDCQMLSKSVVTVLLFLGCLVTYGAVFGFSIMLAIHVRPALRSPKWPSVPAVIRSARLVSNRDCNGLPGYHPHVEYIYAVADTEYSATSISAGLHAFRYLTRSAAARILAEYPIGATVTAFYDPTFPELTVLRPGISLGLLYPAALLACALALAAAVSFAVVHRLFL